MTPILRSTSDDLYARAISKGARHLPLAAFEVWEIRRPVSWMIWEIAKLPLLIGGLSLVVMALGRVFG